MSSVYRRKTSRKSKIYAFRAASEAIGKLDRGCEIFGFNKGQFSLIDITKHALYQIGGGDVDILTWAINIENIDKLVNLKHSGEIRNFRLITDYSVQSMHPEYCAKLRRAFGDQAIRVAKNHAKIILIRNDEWNLSIRSSMNLNDNRRLEYFEISDDAELMGFMLKFFEEWWRTKSTGASFEYNGKFHGDALKKFGVNNDDDFDFNVENIDINIPNFNI